MADPLDAFDKHEVLHTASIIAELFEQHILKHRYTRSDGELKAAAERLADQLGDFYQLVGRRSGG